MIKRLILVMAVYSALMIWGCVQAFGQTILKTPTNISYYKFGSGPDVIVYFDGYSSAPNPLASNFYRYFLPSIQSKVTCYIPIPFANSGWEKPWNNSWLGTDFLNYISDQHVTERIFVTGYSAGGDPGYVYGARRVTAFASVAGSDSNYNPMMNWRDNGIPVWSFIGTSDTSENSRANCEKTWIAWFSPVGRLKGPTYVTGGHGSVDDYAYNPVNGLWAWFDSIGKPVDPEPIPVDDPVLKAYFRSSENKLIIETQSGKVLKFTPD